MTDRDDEDFAALLAASEAGAAKRQRRLAAGDVVRGRVISVGATTAFVAVGGKAEAAIDVAEFRDPATGAVSLQEGDEIEATVVDDGSRSGLDRAEARRRPRRPRAGRARAGVRERHPGRRGRHGRDQGRLRRPDRQRARVLPGSQIDRRRTEGRTYVGQRLRFRITKLEAGGRNVVVSRRQLLEEEAAAQAAETWERLARGRRRHRHGDVAARVRRVRRPRRRRGADPRERARPRARRRSGATCCRSASRSRRRS